MALPSAKLDHNDGKALEIRKKTKQKEALGLGIGSIAQKKSSFEGYVDGGKK